MLAFEPRLVRFGVGELQRIGRDEALGRTPSRPPSNSIRSRSVALTRKWCAHFGTDVEVRREILVVDDLRAAGALDPEALGNAAGLLGRRPRSACGPS